MILVQGLSRPVVWIRIAAPDSYIRYIESYLFFLSKRIKIVPKHLLKLLKQT
jgi:hypothetical protein